jgi:ligand-binding SRPBCC domain-containing protein
MTSDKSYRLERRQFIPRPIDEAFAFFREAANLGRITPPSLGFRILTPQPIVIEQGTLIDYRLSLLGVPFRWRTLIERFEPPHCFSDVQARGPYKFWRHTHEFQEQDGGTLMIDRVEYRLHLGPIGWLANGLFVRRQLAHIFDFRYRTIEQLLAETRPAAGQKPGFARQTVT